MKPLNRIAIVLGVAQVAVLVAAARRPTHPDVRGACGPDGRRGRHGPGRPHGQHGSTGGREHGPGRRHGGPPPWARERLTEWHHAQHAGDPAGADAEPGTPDGDVDAD